MPKTIKEILVKGHHPFLIPQKIAVEASEHENGFRWLTPVYWLVQGLRGRHWCLAVGKNGAEIVYQGIPCNWEEKYPPRVYVPAHQTLQPTAIFWIKEAGEPSQPWRMRRGQLVPAPDGYSDITPKGYYNK